MKPTVNLQGPETGIILSIIFNAITLPFRTHEPYEMGLFTWNVPETCRFHRNKTERPIAT